MDRRGDIPVHQPVEWWPWTVLFWLWLDKDAGLPDGIARYRRDGLLRDLVNVNGHHAG